jgi:hypothetical protein
MYRKLIAALAIVLTQGAHASESIRCGRWVVDSSVTVDELLKKCGEPASVRYEEADVRTMGPNGAMIKIGTSVTEYWTYDRGSQAAPVIVTIRDGKVRSIERDQS